MHSTKHTRKIGLFSLTLITTAALMACGGGGSGGDTDDNDNDNDDGHSPTTPVLITTTVMDGLLRNALVCADLNANGTCETNEPQARTASDGRAVLNVTGLNMASTRLLAVVGTDAIDADFGPVTQAYTLQTPGTESKVISPLTTLIRYRMDATGESSAAAKFYVKERLGGGPPTPPHNPPNPGGPPPSHRATVLRFGHRCRRCGGSAA